MRRRKRKLHVNNHDKKLLGVCSGIASFLDVPALIVRIVFVVSMLMGAWFLIPAYFISYFFMDSQSGQFKEGVINNKAFKHFQNVDYKKKLTRNSKDKKFLGVCSGIADYLEIDVSLVRIISIVLLFVAGPIPWVAYFLAYFILDDNKEDLLFWDKQADETDDYSQDPSESLKTKGFKEGHRKSKKEEADQREKFKKKDYSKRREFKYCARKFANLHERLTKMEAFVTSKQFKLHQEFKDI